MILNTDDKLYTSIKPSAELEDFVHIYWVHHNNLGKTQRMTIVPDSFFKLIIQIIDNKVVACFLTGLWTKEIDVLLPENTVIYGVKFKILAPEYIFNTEIAELVSSYKTLCSEFWNINNLEIGNFKIFVKQLENILLQCLKRSRKIKPKKIQFSRLLYKLQGNTSVEEISSRIKWSRRQINRYLNKYLGVSLKTYLNIQKCHSAYTQIRHGQFFPDNGYYDQAHFIREIKKHTGKTPKELFEKQNDRFIQLKRV